MGVNIFTVDLEDWYCSRALEAAIPRSQWSACESRVRIGTTILLTLLERYHVEATFFVLGYIANREPELVAEIAARGHDIATHGYDHRHLAEGTSSAFTEDLDRSIAAIEGVTGKPVRGYRAPMFSITSNTEDWALPILKSRGILYDSSIVPAWGHPEYGMPRVPTSPFRHANGVLEIPISVAKFAGVRIPATGGGYFRHLPYAVSRRLMRRCNRDGQPVVFYIHPWELDRDQPRIPLPLLRHLRHYHGIDYLESKLESLLKEFSFTSMRVLFEQIELSNPSVN